MSSPKPLCGALAGFILVRFLVFWIIANRFPNHRTAWTPRPEYSRKIFEFPFLPVDRLDLFHYQIGNGFLFPFCRYGGKNLLKLPASVHPASCDRQVFLLLFQRVVDLIAIRDTDPGIIFQKLPGMGNISGSLILIQDDLVFGVHSSGAVNPHITFGSCRAAVVVYKHRCFICLNDMVIIQFPVEIVIENGKVFLSETDHPVCHVLPGDGKSIALEFLFQTIQRNRIDIFAVHNGCCKCWGNGTAMKQPSGMLRFYHMPIFLVGIDADMMFLHFYFGRNETVSPGYGIRELFPAIFTKLSSEFIFCHVEYSGRFCTAIPVM